MSEKYASSPTAYNRAYLAPLRSAQILLRRTSDTLGTLYSIRKPLKSTHHLLSTFITLRGEL